MRDSTNALREHLARVLDWEDAHVGLDKAIDGIPPDKRGTRPAGFEHSPWQLLEHIRLAQEDILDFCVNDQYAHNLAWPDDYWPRNPAPPGDQAWTDSIASYNRSRERLKALAREVTDLTATVPTGKGAQTYFRAILLTADHTAYHVGQLVAVRRALGIWK
jgi:hypothetical protein